ncbi:MAG: Peptidase M50 [Methanoculleus marisnigri]|uniref:Peptidase M50 n=1 Tax=Methanoculleus marisnigri TaxID=2198 RepID=A0A101IRZ2_9EURY|nr:MAG: Peptidase M50 [Methanoculleus marisnigri]
MDGTRPGETITLTAAEDGVESTYTLTLSEWPEALADDRDSGFMGVYYYNAPAVKEHIGNIADLGPLAPLYLTIAPIDAFIQGNTQQLAILLADTPEQIAWEEPFPFFWGTVHLFFWDADPPHHDADDRRGGAVRADDRVGQISFSSGGATTQTLARLYHRQDSGGNVVVTDRSSRRGRPELHYLVKIVQMRTQGSQEPVS